MPSANEADDAVDAAVNANGRRRTISPGTPHCCWYPSDWCRRASSNSMSRRRRHRPSGRLARPTVAEPFAGARGPESPWRKPPAAAAAAVVLCTAKDRITSVLCARPGALLPAKKIVNAATPQTKSNTARWNLVPDSGDGRWGISEWRNLIHWCTSEVGRQGRCCRRRLPPLNTHH